MGALASAIFKILIYLAPEFFLTFYYCQAGVSTRNGKILLTLSTRNIKILNMPWSHGMKSNLLILDKYMVAINANF